MATATPGTEELKIAHVLFMDLVGYSLPPMDDKARIIWKLQELVSATAELNRARPRDQLIRLPSGDGMALVFFEEPAAPLRCACEIARELKKAPDIHLRMGIHSGPVYSGQDINANLNVSGGGVNIAQRVMDCGDAGHILLSDTAAHFVSQISEWSGHLRDLGTANVKHGQRIHLHSFYNDEIGNPRTPQKLRQQHSQKRRKASLAATGVFLALAAGLVSWRLSAKSLPASILTQPSGEVLKLISSGSPPPANGQATPPQLQFELMAMRKGETGFSPLKDGDTLDSEVDDYLVVMRPLAPGYIYVFQIDSSGKCEWLFPQNQSSTNSTGANPVTPRAMISVPSEKKLYLDRTVGIEHIYAVFSARPWLELERLLSNPIAPRSFQNVQLRGIVQQPNRLRVRGVGGDRFNPVVVNVDDVLPLQPNSDGKPPALSVTNKTLRARGSLLVVERWFNHVDAN